MQPVRWRRRWVRFVAAVARRSPLLLLLAAHLLLLLSRFLHEPRRRPCAPLVGSCHSGGASCLLASCWPSIHTHSPLSFARVARFASPSQQRSARPVPGRATGKLEEELRRAATLRRNKKKKLRVDEQILEHLSQVFFCLHSRGSVMSVYVDVQYPP